MTPGPSFTPANIKSEYGLPAGATASGEVAGVVEFTGSDDTRSGLLPTDVQYYLGNLSLPAAQFHVIGNSGIVSRGETTLDIELMLGVATGVTAYVYCLEYGADATYAHYADALEGFAATALGGSNVTFTHGISTVWSMSYGGPEWLTDSGAPDPQLLRVNTIFKHLTDAGITVTASSGDAGSFFVVMGPGTKIAVLSPNWPASSPYVVGVGASARVVSGEVVCSSADGNVITSGGGYSQVFETPAWQQGLSSNPFRGVPDVAAVGAWIYTILSGQPAPLFGTSASSPIIASFIATMNRNTRSANASAGTLRLATQFLATQPAAAFTDVTSGSNCAGESGPSPLSNNYPIYAAGTCYNATVGWDAVTGRGTPVLATLFAAAATWQPAHVTDAPTSPTPVTTLAPTTAGPSTTAPTPHSSQNFTSTPAPTDSSHEPVMTTTHVVIVIVAIVAILAFGGVIYACHRSRSNRSQVPVWNPTGKQDPAAQYSSMPVNYRPQQTYNTAATTDYV